VRSLHREEGEKALGPIRERFDRAGVPYVTHIGVGDPSDVIVQFAQDQGAQQIYLTSTHRSDTVSLLANLESQLRERVAAPVTLLR
jgi:nucleotide-binding universal stress UspA family protein